MRPATSTWGSPVPAISQLVEPLGSLMTPQSLETYRSPFESAAMPVAGKSGNAVAPEPSRFWNVTLGPAGLNVTENTWPGVAGVSEL